MARLGVPQSASAVSRASDADFGGEEGQDPLFVIRDMSQTQRTILAVILSMVVFFGYTHFFAPKPLPKKSQPQNAEALTPTGPQILGQGLPATIQSPPTNGLPSPLGLSGAPEFFPLANQKIAATVSNRGGVMTHWNLHDFHQSADQKSKLIDLLANGREGEALVLTLGDPIHDAGTQFKVQNLAAENTHELLLSWESKDLLVKKVYRLRPDVSDYLMDVHVELTNKSKGDLAMEPRLWIFRPQKENKKQGGIFSFLAGPPDIFAPSLFIDGKLAAESNFEKLPEATTKSGHVDWAAISDRYFLMALIGRQGGTEVRYGKTPDSRVYTSLGYGTLILKAGQSEKLQFATYFGPKKRKALQDLGSNLEMSVDYGWFGFIAIPLLWLLIFFHQYVGNWGLTIIALTFFVKLLLHPINKKSMLSMKAMQKIQPQLKDLREKFKNDKQRLNMEMMSLFKTNKVNPMGGCLPMIVQLPVYFGLYRVLWNSIELYHAPFYWIYKDLSAPDPYMISPILLGIFMMLQQKFTPQATTMEPAQQKMMMIMPVMFSVIMLFVPFGLVLYIFVNTVMSVIQQYMIHRDLTFISLVKKLVSKRAPA